MSLPAVFHNSPQPVCIEGILELPEGVASEVMAREELPAPWKIEGLPLEPRSFDDTRRSSHLRCYDEKVMMMV